MPKIVEYSKDVPIFNTWDQMEVYSGDRVAITYQVRGDSRMMRTPGWHVVRLVDGCEMTTDPKAHWTDHGSKFFILFGPGRHHEVKKAVLVEAIAWANKHYGKREFVRNRMGDYVEREVNEAYPIPFRRGA